MSGCARFADAIGTDAINLHDSVFFSERGREIKVDQLRPDVPTMRKHRDVGFVDDDVLHERDLNSRDVMRTQSQMR